MRLWNHGVPMGLRRSVTNNVRIAASAAAAAPAIQGRRRCCSPPSRCCPRTDFCT